MCLSAAASLTAQTVRYLSDEEALALEHQTRFSRLKRFAQANGIYPEPEMHSYVIPRDFMPADFHYDIPVLRIVFPENTFFDTASSEIKPSAIPIIKAMASMLDGDVPDVNVFVAGHADSRGGEVYNHNLSVNRGRNVADILNGSRKNHGAIWSIGFGKSVPLYPNDSDVNMAYNRRVEFLISSRPDAIAYWLQDQVVDVCRTSDAAARLRCMRDFKTERKLFVAEKARQSVVSLAERPVRVSPSPDVKRKAVPESESRVAVRPNQDSMTIKLNENRIRVRSIEH
ncbi:hypothetical protein A0U87_20635 [Sphingobium sp. MP9-4]|nr:hypothetical protein A0U87_20635 [Sphingobium sp. MP9-4]